MMPNGCAQARQPKEAGPWIGAAASKGKQAGGTWRSGPGLGGGDGLVAAWMAWSGGSRGVSRGRFDWRSGTVHGAGWAK
jgi:hypothetical protein